MPRQRPRVSIWGSAIFHPVVSPSIYSQFVAFSFLFNSHSSVPLHYMVYRPSSHSSLWIPVLWPLPPIPLLRSNSRRLYSHRRRLSPSSTAPSHVASSMMTIQLLWGRVSETKDWRKYAVVRLARVEFQILLVCRLYDDTSCFLSTCHTSPSALTIRHIQPIFKI